MKANELMIDDWVYNKNIDKPMQIYPTIFSQMFRSNPNATTEDYNIFPVTLTSEILEKNGFEWTATHSYMVLVVDSIHIAFGFYKDCLSISDWNENGNTQITSIQCKFVHQLQHALRLCGIDKEIEL